MSKIKRKSFKNEMRKNVKELIKEMEFNYPLFTEHEWKTLKDKPQEYQRGIYQYVPNAYWGLWTNLKPYWKNDDHNKGVGIYQELENIWDEMGEEIEGGDFTISVNKVIVRGNRRNGELFCKYSPKYLKKCLEKDNSLHEILYKRPTKLFVDIDVKCDNALPNNALHNYYIEAIQEVKRVFTGIINYGKKKMRKPEFIMSQALGVDSNNHYKYSCHLICKGYYINADKRILLGNYLNKVLPEAINLYVDKCMYEEKRKLKLPNQLKLDDRVKKLTHRAQKIQENTDLMDYVLQNIKGCKCLDKSLVKMSKTLKIKGNKLIREMRVAPVTDTVTPNIDCLTRLSPLQILHLFDTRPKHMCQQFHNRIMMWSMANGIFFDEWYEIFSQYWRNKYLPHNRNREIPYNENFTYKQIWRKRWNELQDKNIPIKMEWIKKALRAQYPDFYEEDYKKFNEAIIDADNIKGMGGDYTIFKPTEDNPFLPVEMIKQIKKKYILLSTGLGQGKTWDTQLITKDIIKMGYGKALYICNRIALKEDILGKFIDTKKFNLADETFDYKDLKSGKKTLPSTGFVLLTTLESLPQFPHTDYDLVVVDECEAVNMTFLTDSVKSTLPAQRYEKVVNAYGDLLTTAKKVIMCDGLLMKRTMTFIDDIEGMSDFKSYHYYHTIVSNNKNLQGRSILYYRDSPKCSAHYRFMNDLLEHVYQGKRVYLFMPHLTGKSSPLKISRDKGNDVEGQGVLLLKNYFMKYCNLTEEDIRIHYGNSSNNKRLQNVNAYWENGKLVISTSCITNGVSYDNQEYIYDSVWLLTDSSFISARDTAQISARMRYLNSKKIRVCDLTNGANPTMFNRPNYVSKPLFKDDIRDKKDKYLRWDINYAKWLRLGKLVFGRKKKFKHIVKSIIDANREAKYCKILWKWDKRKIQRYEIAIKNLHKEITREHYVRGSPVLIRMFKKLGIEVWRTIEPDKRDEAEAKEKFNNFGMTVERIDAEWEYGNIAVIDDNILYEQYRFQNHRGLIGNAERHELKKRNFLNEFKDDTPEDVLEEMFDSQVYKGFKKLVRGSLLSKVLGTENKETGQIESLNMEMDEWKTFDVSKIKLKWRLKRQNRSLLRTKLDIGGMYNTKGLIRKVMSYYFSKRYVEEIIVENKEDMYVEYIYDEEGKHVSSKWVGKVKKERTGRDTLTGDFYKDLITFLKWFDFENPLTFEKRDYPLYMPFTTRVKFKDGNGTKGILHPEDIGGIDEDKVETLSVNYWVYDEVKEIPYSREILQSICAYNPYLEWEKKRQELFMNMKQDDFKMELKLNHMNSQRNKMYHKWKKDSVSIWNNM